MTKEVFIKHHKLPDARVRQLYGFPDEN